MLNLLASKVMTYVFIGVIIVAVEDSEFLLSSEGSVIRLDKRAIYQMELPEGVKIDGAAEEKTEEVKEEVKEEVAPAEPVTSEAKDGDAPVVEVKEEVAVEVVEEKPAEKKAPAKKATKKTSKK